MAKGAIYLEKKGDKLVTDLESIDGLIAYGMKATQYLMDTEFKGEFKKLFKDLDISDSMLQEILERMIPYLATSLMACVDTAIMDNRVLPKMLAKMQSNPKYSMYITDIQTGEAARKRKV